MGNFGSTIPGGARPPGVYQVEEDAEGTRCSAEKLNASFFYVDGGAVRDKASFLGEVASAMRFPGWFGDNWDAFEDCVTDLDWDPAKGYVLFFDGFGPFARREPQQWRVARSILESAVEYWKGEGVPFYVLLRRTPSREP